MILMDTWLTNNNESAAFYHDFYDLVRFYMPLKGLFFYPINVIPGLLIEDIVTQSNLFTYGFKVMNWEMNTNK